MDIVSEGELRRALAAGVPGRAHRVLRRRQDPRRDGLRPGGGHSLLQRGIRARARGAVARSRRQGRRAPISIRVNPDVDAKTHEKISTGKSENKFGIPIARARDVYAQAAALTGIAVTGVDMHIGSQITDLQPFDDAAALLAELARDLMADGHDCTISISAAASAFPIARTTSRRPIRRPMRRSSSATPGTLA